MQQTLNYNLNKPDGTDAVNVQDFNDNADIVDRELKKNADGLAAQKNAKGQPNGFATLDEYGNVPAEQLENIDTSNLASKAELNAHKAAVMPHQFSDGTTTYYYGFKANTAKDGLIFIYEEVL